MLRRFIYPAYLFYVVLLAVGIGLLWRASPGPGSQDILGVGIGSHESATGITYLSGRKLDCERRDVSTSYTSRCTIDIAGKPLTIDARRNAPPNMMLLGGACAATFDGQTVPCEVRSRHAGVHWFAFVPDLGLEPRQVDTLRQQHPVENLPESAFFWGVLVVALLTTFLTVAVVVARMRENPRRWSTQPMVMGAASVIGMVVFFGSCLLGAIVTSGFWD